MQKNETLLLRADNLGAEMEGVCRHEGVPVFVPGLLPDEEAQVRIVKVEKRYAFGKMLGLPSSPSLDRVQPDCAVYPQCGGCTSRHMTYDSSLRAKRQHVQDCMQRIGHLAVDVPPVLGMAAPFAYRNKTALPAAGDISHPMLGFFAPRSHRLVPAVSCPNAMPPAPSVAQAVQDWMTRYRIPPYHEETRTGLIRHLVVRVNRKQEAMVTLVCRDKTVPHLSELLSAILPLGVISVYLNFNPGNTNVIFGKSFRLLYGRETLPDTLCGLQFELSPASFFQVNPLQTEILYETALNFADLRPEDSLLDVYCGAGTISLMMARHCKTVTGIEIVPDAVCNARENARRNGIQNASFVEGKAEILLPEMIKQGSRPDVIVVDPPRKGLEPAVIEAIAKAAPDRLVYISCNPATQARDAALLKEQGYLIQKIQPVDMFPYTSHVETVVQLSKGNISTQNVRVEFSLEDMDMSGFQQGATYEQIQEWIQEKYGFHVTHLNIAKTKQKCGIIERQNYNLPKSENSRSPDTPKEKEEAIIDAFLHFKMM